MTEQERVDEILRMAERYKMDEGRRRLSMVEASQMGVPEPTPLPYSPPVGTAASTGGPTEVFQPVPSWLQPGSLRRGLDQAGVIDALGPGGVVAKSIGPHAYDALTKAGTIANLATPRFGTDANINEPLQRGDYGGAASATALGTAGAALDMLPGEAAIKGILKGITGGFKKAKEYAPEGAMAIGGAIKGGRSKAAEEATEFLTKDPTWYHGISENKLRRPLEEMSATRVSTTELAPRKIITPSELEGEYMVPLIGDRTAAGSKLTAVNEQPLAHEVTMQGGPDYMRTNKALWASQKGAANTFQDTRVGKLAETTGQAPLAVYTAMSPTGGDYAHMTADTLIGMLPSSEISKKNLAKFRTTMKNRGYPIPEFSPDNIDELRKHLLGPESGRAREAFVQEMARKPFQEAGFPDVGSARFATTEPALLHDPSLSSGYMFGRTAPGQPTVTNPTQHMTYSTQIPGQAVGGFEFPLPKDKMWLDYYRGRAAMGRDPRKSTEDYAFRLQQPSQRATPEWVDQAEEYQRRRRAETR